MSMSRKDRLERFPVAPKGCNSAFYKVSAGGFGNLRHKRCRLGARNPAVRGEGVLGKPNGERINESAGKKILKDPKRSDETAPRASVEVLRPVPENPHSPGGMEKLKDPARPRSTS